MMTWCVVAGTLSYRVRLNPMSVLYIEIFVMPRALTAVETTFAEDVSLASCNVFEFYWQNERKMFLEIINLKKDSSQYFVPCRNEPSSVIL